jgi:hypothetical protein
MTCVCVFGGAVIIVMSRVIPCLAAALDGVTAELKLFFASRPKP